MYEDLYAWSIYSRVPGGIYQLFPGDRAAGKSIDSLHTLRQLLLLIPMILILPIFFGLQGILYAGPVADISSFLAVLCFVVHELRKLNKKIAETA